MKKYTLMCLPVVCAAIAPLCADNAGKHMSRDQNQMQNDQMQGGMKQITPVAPAMVTHSADPFVTVEYIFWKAVQEDLEYAINGIAPNAATSVNEKGRIHRPDFDFNSGFKVGAGLKFKHDGWDMYANYTWLFSDGNEDVAELHGNTVMQATDTLAYNTTREVLGPQKSEADWTLHFNALDLELGRNFFISPRLTLRPHFGLKLAWIDQDSKIEYSHVNISGSTGNNNVLHIQSEQDHFGVGIRAGLNTAWYMWNKWSVYGNVAAAALWSSFDDEGRIVRHDPTLGKLLLSRTDQDFHVVTPVLELGLGLRFETDFYNEDYQFVAQAGWEEQVWFDEAHATHGNLTLQGLTVKAGFSF